MSHTAQTTYYGLPIYEDKAGNQPTYLGDWNDAMRTVDSSLNAVAAQSSGVVTTANQALTTAQQAQQTANAANTVANAAQQTANGLSDSVETAQQTAEAANTAAGTAQSTAESANSTAQAASTTASNALSQAQSAASTAGTAQTAANNAQSTANTVANKMTNLKAFGVISDVISSNPQSNFQIPASSILSALRLSSKPASGTLVVTVCNGDVQSAPDLSIRTVAINQSNWNVVVYLGEPANYTFRYNACVFLH